MNTMHVAPGERTTFRGAPETPTRRGVCPCMDMGTDKTIRVCISRAVSVGSGVLTDLERMVERVHHALDTR